RYPNDAIAALSAAFTAQALGITWIDYNVASSSRCSVALRLRADVTGLRPNQPIYSLLLEYVRGPSGNAPHREDIGETVARNLERLEQERRIELDIRVETPPGPVLREQRERLRLHGFGKADAVFSATQGRCGRLEHVGARIAHTVDAMAEAHQAFLARERVFEPGTNVLETADGIEHVEHRPGRAAMQRSLQGTQCADDGRQQSRARGGDDARREGRGVE